MRKLALITLATLLATASAGFCELVLLPNKVTGYYMVDRWGRGIFVREGTDVVFVTPEAGKALEKFAGKLVEVEVGAWPEQQNQAVMLDQVKGVKEAKSTQDLIITVMPVKKKVEAGKGVTVELKIGNPSNKDQKVGTRGIFICLASAQGDEPKDFKDPENRAFWYHRGAIEQNEKWTMWAVRSIRMEMDEEKMIADGKKLRPMENGGGADAILWIGPGGEYSTQVTVGMELPAGEYEVFAYDCWDVPVISPRAAFDVAEKK